MLSAKDVTDLYLQYGFERGPFTDHYCVFFNQQGGYFKNAEVIILDDDFDEDKINQAEYTQLGYSIRVKRFESLSKLHEELFTGFFSLEATKRRLEKEYADFLQQQSRKILNCDYEYIQGNYIEDGNVHKSNVILRIASLLKLNDPQLIILEASAGYGKTCTSFEVMHHLTSNFDSQVTLMAELSKNRKAPIFRYVLLSEINTRFSWLNAELVTYEIQNGRVILIIDGFDELLSKSYTNLEDGERTSKQDAQTMLDTIAQLFPEGSKTKVLLTTRKSSIFTGPELDEWIDCHLRNCNISRLQLSTPSLKDWIGPEKQKILLQNNININNILNPVLLALLRNEDTKTFSVNSSDNKQIIKRYIDLLLQRETERQDLPLKPDEQLSIMTALASYMVQYEISAEHIDFIKELLQDIVKDDIQEYLNRYNFRPDASESRPKEDEFVTKLSQHALLDRVPAQSNMIGFINEFIFGLLIGKALFNHQLPTEALGEKHFDLVTTAYASYDEDTKHQLYSLISSNLKKIRAQKRLVITMNLIGNIGGTYNGEYFDGITFEDGVEISTPLSFVNCIFSECVFRNCIISNHAFSHCQFYNCSFYENEFQVDTSAENNLYFLSCIGCEELASTFSSSAEDENSNVDYRRIVLEQYWKPGYDKAEPRRALQTLMRGISPELQPGIISAIDALLKDNILIKHLHSYDLNFKKMDQIRSILRKS